VHLAGLFAEEVWERASWRPCGQHLPVSAVIAGLPIHIAVLEVWADHGEGAPSSEPAPLRLAGGATPGMMRAMIDPHAVMTWKALLSSWDGWLVFLVVAVLVPARGYRVYRRLLGHTDGVVPGKVKVRIYGSTIGLQWLLAGGTVLIAGRHGLSLADLGQTAGGAPRTLAVTAALLLIAGAYLVVNLRQIRRARPGRLAAGVRRLQSLLPATRWELAVFTGVAVTAGICEELLYRGWLVNFLAVAVGSIWGGVVAGAAVFGLAHAYQGSRGMLLAGVLGLVFGCLFVSLGSLVPGQVLHAAVDVAGGITGAAAAARLKETGAESGAAAAHGPSDG
jgi:membrane protease YdiL (CAAX protease family)